MEQILLYQKSLSGKGRNIVKNFVYNFQKNIIDDIYLYANYSINDQGLDHLFWYGEQQLKTAVTTALYKLCDGYMMQEPGVARKVNKSKESKNDYKNGRVDYWCRIGGPTKISILVEMKHAWIRYYSPKKWTIYKYALDRHESAVKQVNDIEKGEFIDDNLFGVALTILPMFSEHKSEDEEVQKMESFTLRAICEQAIKTQKVNACGGCIMDDEFLEITDWSDEDKERYESYPGVVFLWSIYKFTRK